MTEKRSIFLSHSSKNKVEIIRLAEDLRNAGVEVWIFEEHILPGDFIVKKLQEGLTKCDYLGIWLTNDSLESTWVETEWQNKLHEELEKNRVIVIPLLGGNVNIPPLLKDKRFVDFRDDYQAGLNDLLRTLNSKRELQFQQQCRAVILAGGFASRLWPLTIDRPKALIRIAGGTLLHHLLVALNEVQSIEEVIISVDEDKANYFSEIILQLRQASIHPIAVMEHALVNGKIKGPVAKLTELINSGRMLISPDTWNLVIGVDNIFTFSLADFVLFAQKRGASSNVVIEKEVVPRKFGVAKTSGDILDSVLEKPQLIIEEVTKISTACYIYNGVDTRSIPDFLRDPSNDDSLGALVAWLCSQSKVLACSFSSEWADVGTMDGLLTGNRLLITKVSRQPALIPGKYKIREPVYIEDGVRIENSIVGPNVFIGHGCHIKDSEITNAIIYENCSINHCAIFDQIVAGEGSRFEGNISAAVYGPMTSLTSIRD